MKKILLSSIIVLSLFLLVGCKNKEIKETTSPEVIELEGNPTTGYEWTCIIEDDSIAKLEAIFEADETTSAITGEGGTYLFTVTGLKEGKTTVTCKYARGWEETDDDKERHYNITVNKDLKVSIEGTKK